MAAWNLAVVVDAIARESPDRDVIVQGARRLTWWELADRARALAWFLQSEAALAPGDKVAISLPNCPQYLETFVAARKLRCVPLNVGVVASSDTLHGMLDASDAKVVVCSHAMTQTVRDAIRRIPKRWRPPIVEEAEQYERGITDADVPREWDVELPSADDLIFLASYDVSSAIPEPEAALLPVAPLPFGDGLKEALGALMRRERVVFADSVPFDPTLVWQAVADERVTTLAIGGDAFARPLLASLSTVVGAQPSTTLRKIVSSGARLSAETAHAFKTAMPDVSILDTFDAPDELRPTAQHLIRPADVETRLCKHASIADCVVIGVSDPRIGKKVVAVVEVTQRHYLDGSELAAWCRAHLPSTMTPARFVFVENIDRSASGEVDYPELRRLVIDQLVREH